MVSLATPVDRTLYFDFLPIRLPKIGSYILRLQLFTVPGQVHYNATRKLVLTGADGIVLVADSQTTRMDANIESLENLRDNLAEQKIDLDAVPLSFQYNKRDLPNIAPIEDLNRSLNPDGRFAIGTCAVTGDGVYEGLEVITKEVLKDLKRREVLIHDEKKASEPFEKQIAFTKEDQGILNTVQEFSESSAKTIRAPVSEELTATYPANVKDLGFDVPSTKRSEPSPPGHEGNRTEPKTRVDAAPTSPPPAANRSTRPTTQSTDMPAAGEYLLSFAPLWPLGSEAKAQDIERAIAENRSEDAIKAIWEEIEKSLHDLKTAVSDTSEKSIIALLGLDGRQYLEIAHLARQKNLVDTPMTGTLLRSYLFLLQLLMAKP